MEITETKQITDMLPGAVYMHTTNDFNGHTVALNFITDEGTFPLLDQEGAEVTSTVDFMGTFICPSPNMEVNVSGSTDPLSFTLRLLHNKTA